MPSGDLLRKTFLVTLFMLFYDFFFCMYDSFSSDTLVVPLCDFVYDLFFFRIVMFLPALIVSFAFTTSALNSFWCESIQFTVNQDTDVDDSFAVESLHFGMWYQKRTRIVENAINPSYLEQQQSCEEWTTDADADGTLQAIRASSLITLIVGGLLAIILWFRPCLVDRISKRTWRAIAVVYMAFVTPMQALTFLLFQSNACTENPVVALIEHTLNREDLYETKCSWDQGSTANVFATFLWFSTGIAMIYVGEPLSPQRGPPEIQTVTYERTKMPDGTVSVNEVAVVKGTTVALPTKDV